jgi:hypothetical protein
MRVGRCVFGLAMLIALDGCGHASARHSAPADPPRTAPASSPASIGHLDCSTLSVPITLDNTAWLATRFFVVERRQPAGGQRQVVMLAAGERRSLDLAVRDHRDTTVYISDEDDGETLAAAEIEVSCSPHPAFDARATLQPVSCRDHTLPVMLDNTRSEIPAEFSLESSDGAPEISASTRHTECRPAIRRSFVCQLATTESSSTHNSSIPLTASTSGSVTERGWNTTTTSSKFRAADCRRLLPKPPRFDRAIGAPGTTLSGTVLPRAPYRRPDGLMRRRLGDSLARVDRPLRSRAMPCPAARPAPSQRTIDRSTQP